MTLHNFVHHQLKRSPDPITGAAAGAAGGTVVGTAATATALHAAGWSAATVVASASTAGVGATATALGTATVVAAAPVLLPAIGCCAAVGATCGAINWVKKGCKRKIGW